MQISTGLNDFRLGGVLDWAAQGTLAATAEIYDGTQPAFGDSTTGCVLLCTISFAEPLGTISNGEMAITPTDECMNVASGIATWARIKNGAGDHGWDCAVSDLAGTAPLKMASTQLYAGGYARIVSGTLR